MVKNDSHSDATAHCGTGNCTDKRRKGEDTILTNHCPPNRILGKFDQVLFVLRGAMAVISFGLLVIGLDQGVSEKQWSTWLCVASGLAFPLNLLIPALRLFYLKRQDHSPKLQPLAGQAAFLTDLICFPFFIMAILGSVRDYSGPEEKRFSCLDWFNGYDGYPLRWHQFWVITMFMAVMHGLMLFILNIVYCYRSKKEIAYR